MTHTRRRKMSCGKYFSRSVPRKRRSDYTAGTRCTQILSMVVHLAQMDRCTTEHQVKLPGSKHTVRQMTQTSICKLLRGFSVSIYLCRCLSTEVRNSSSQTPNRSWWSLALIEHWLHIVHFCWRWSEQANSRLTTCSKFFRRSKLQQRNSTTSASTASTRSMRWRNQQNYCWSTRQLFRNKAWRTLSWLLHSSSKSKQMAASSKDHPAKTFGLKTWWGCSKASFSKNPSSTQVWWSSSEKWQRNISKNITTPNKLSKHRQILRRQHQEIQVACNTVLMENLLSHKRNLWRR